MGWVFAIYRGIELACIHTMEPVQLEPLFAHWEQKWHRDGGKDINNPKIPIYYYVVQHGTLVHGTAPSLSARSKKARRDR